MVDEVLSRKLPIETFTFSISITLDIVAFNSMYSLLLTNKSYLEFINETIILVLFSEHVITKSAT